MPLFPDQTEDSLYLSMNDEDELLSRNSAHAIKLDDKEWPSVEHYFQATKFRHAQYRQIIRSSESPMAAKELGQSRDYEIRPDWVHVRESVMLRALQAKFELDNLRGILLSTGSRMLVENSPHDSYWGIGKSGSGQNRLGILLMQVRDDLLLSDSTSHA